MLGADMGETRLCFCPPVAGVLQVLLPELLALAAQHGGPASPQPPDAQPEEPGLQLGADLAWWHVAPEAGRSGSSLPPPSHWRPGSWLPPRGQGKIIVTFALAESVFVSALINAQ